MAAEMKTSLGTYVHSTAVNEYARLFPAPVAKKVAKPKKPRKKAAKVGGTATLHVGNLKVKITGKKDRTTYTLEIIEGPHKGKTTWCTSSHFTMD